jgi:hypothetical protein
VLPLAPLEPAAGVVPPSVEPAAGVVVVAELVVDDVVVAAVEEVVVVEVALEEPLVVDTVAPVVPVLAEAPVDALAPALSSVLWVSGTSGGTLDGALSATVVPPQAASATALRVPPSNASDREPCAIDSRPERTHATPAGRAVVEVALRELLAPRAEAKVLDRPGKLRSRRREREQIADHLEGLAGVAVGVDPLGIGLDDHLAAGRGDAQAIAVVVAHLAEILPTRAG